MGILEKHIEREKKDVLAKARLNALNYADRITSALDLMVEFDDRRVDDINDVKESFEKTGRACILLTTKEGYQCLLDEDGKLLASGIVDNDV